MYTYKVITIPVDQACEFTRQLNNALAEGFTMLDSSYSNSVQIITAPRTITPWFYVTMSKRSEVKDPQ